MLKNDTELFTIIKKKLYTPVICDIMDELGRFHQFLPQRIQPIDPAMKLAGRAMPVLMIDVYGHQEEPFGRLTEALDQLEANEIYIATGGIGRCAYWGELLTATAKTRGATGAVVNGWHRDTLQVLEQDFPVFSWGRYAADSAVRTKVVNYRCPIEIENIWIKPGDIIFADLDGVAVIPQEFEIEVIERALEKASTEKIMRKAVEDGMSSTEAFAKYGVL